LIQNDRIMMNTISDIFNDVQRSSQTHKSCSRKLTAAIKAGGSNEQENIAFFLNGGIDRVLLHPGTGASMDRTLRFLGLFLSTADESFLDLAMKHICARLLSSNKLVRQRVCHIVCSTLESLCASKIDLSIELFSLLANHMSIRLKDKVPAVRVAAVKALKYLQVPEESDDQPSKELKRCMRSDTSSTVRVACVDVLTLTDATKNDLCARLKDVKSEVRVAVLRRLAEETDMRQFTVQMRAEILRSALEDREESVRKAVLGLLWKWLSMVDNSNVPKFLNLLNPTDNEDAALLVGATIVEELTKSEATSTSSTKQNLQQLKRTIKQALFKWSAVNESPQSLTPGDVLWVHVRCSYARQFLPVFPASEVCDALLPDAGILCQVLHGLKDTLLDPASHYSRASGVAKAQFSTKCLLSLTPLLIGNTDVSGLTQLMEECADTFLNTHLSLTADCIDGALRAYQELYFAASELQDRSDKAAESAHHAVLTMSLHLRDEAQKLVAVEGDCDDEKEEAEESSAQPKLLLNITERCLQLTQWALQQEVSSVAAKKARASLGTAEVAEEEEEDTPKESEQANADVYNAVLPFVLESLQQPVYQLRQLAVACLGLVCLCDATICQTYRGVILQVAGGDFEEPSIRAQALQSLVDFTIIYGPRYHNDADVDNLLLRLQENGDPESMLVAAESTAKLLHAGAHQEPRLFANLLKFFFLTGSLPDQTANNSGSGDAATADGGGGGDDDDSAAAEEEYQQRLFLASCARLQQILSIFFHVFSTTDVVVDKVVAEAIPYLVADMTNEIKDGTVQANALSKILRHLLSLCESKNEVLASSLSAKTVGVPGVADAMNTIDRSIEAIAEKDDDSSTNEKEEEEDKDKDPADISPQLPPPQQSSSLDMYKTALAATAAALTRELLKLGTSKVEKAINKEFVKILTTLSVESWAVAYDLPAIERVFDTLLLSGSHDKATTKHLESLMELCVGLRSTGSISAADGDGDSTGSPVVRTSTTTTTSSSSSSSSMFVAFSELAPGLADLIELCARSSVLDQSMDGGCTTAPNSAIKPPVGRRSSSSSSQQAKSRGRSSRKSAVSDDDDEEEEEEEEEEGSSDSDDEEGEGDEEEEEDDNNEAAEEGDINALVSPTKNFVLSATGRTSLSRSSKAAAAKRISFQLEEESSALTASKLGAGAEEVAKSSNTRSSRRRQLPNNENVVPN